MKRGEMRIPSNEEIQKELGKRNNISLSLSIIDLELNFLKERLEEKINKLENPYIFKQFK